MSFFKDYKDESENATNTIDEMNLEDIFGDELQDIDDDDSTSDFDDVDDDLLYSLLNDDKTSAESFLENVEPEPELEVQENKVEVIEPEVVPVTQAIEKETFNKTESVVKKTLTEEEKRAVTVITKGTTINGSIVSDCSLDVMGTINGDVECYGKLTISGKVVGNTKAAEIYINTDRLEGSIKSEGSVKIGLGTVVVGDIYASSGVFAGAVKGEIDVEGPIVIDSTAIIKGNIRAGSIQVNNGAVIEGFCSLSNPSVDIETIFE